MKVYVLMQWDFDWERDHLVEVFKTRKKAMEEARLLAEYKIQNRTDKKIVDGFDFNEKKIGYIVQAFDECANEDGINPWENEWMFYVVEKEVLKD